MSRPVFSRLQWTVQKFISRLAGKLCACRWAWLKNILIRRLIQYYQIDMHECEKEEVDAYEHVNEFFMRKLKLGSRRLIAQPGRILSPVDGRISQMGAIREGMLVQAKGRTYTLADLLAGDKDMLPLFHKGHFFTFYLAPKDYHRVHMPVTGKLTKTVYVPGFLFSVNTRNTQNVSQLFTRNERVISFFETDIGAMAIIQVGALLVGNIGTAAEGLVTAPSRQAEVHCWSYPNRTHAWEQAQEMGYFKFGSTVILLFTPDDVEWSHTLDIGQPVLCGQPIGSYLERQHYGAP